MVFLDVAQAFNRVWHEGLINKLNHYLPKFIDLIQSYLSDRLFHVKHENEYSKLNVIKVGVPQGSVLGPILYLIYTRDLPQSKLTTIATFTVIAFIVNYHTAILVVDNSIEEANRKLQKF